MDIDVITTVGKLSCVWKPVPGAAAYEVAILGSGGGFVTSPPWVNVGNVISASLSPLPLIEGAIYQCAVRALDAMSHASVDAISDGVTVSAPVMTGSGGGGASGTGGMGGDGGMASTTTGNGGMSNTTTGAGGSSSSGGNGGMSGTTATTGTTGTSSSGGSGESGGCGCRVAGESSEETGAGLLALGALLGVTRRRRRR